MPHLPWMHESQAGHSGTSESESLQTDVMRFLAILGFCLVAVFALVQGLGGETQTLQPSAEVDPELAALQARLQRRVTELRTEQIELERSVSRARRLDEAAASRVDALQSKVHDLQLEAQRMTQVRDEIVAEVVRNEAQMNVRRAQLEALKKMPVKIDQSPARGTRQVPPRIADRPRHEQVPPPAPSVSAVQEAVKQASLAEAAAKKEPPRAPATDKGYDLRFDSAAALRSLVGSGRVRFYARAVGQRFRAGVDDGEVRFTPASLSGSFYEMTPNTVPEEFVAALIEQVPGATREGIEWGVTLPTAVQASIRRLSQGDRGGVILIRANERVVLQAGS